MEKTAHINTLYTGTEHAYLCQLVRSNLVTPVCYQRSILAVWEGCHGQADKSNDLSSAASVQQSVGSNPGRDSCVPEQDT